MSSGSQTPESGEETARRETESLDFGGTVPLTSRQTAEAATLFVPRAANGADPVQGAVPGVAAAAVADAAAGAAAGDAAAATQRLDATRVGPPDLDGPDLDGPGLDGPGLGGPGGGGSGLERRELGSEAVDPAFGNIARQRGLRAARQSAETAKEAAEAAKDAADAVKGRIRRVTHANGAGASGLGHVIEMSAVNSAGDVMITLALANSLFFTVQPNEARTKVALYLLVTMVPFTLLAPLIGPLLDRLRGGRRFAMALTALIRALLALVMARTIASGSIALYPAAFGCLAASKAFGVSRAAVIPRVLPEGTTLVRANSRISLSALAASLIATPIAEGLNLVGPAWVLGFAALVYVLCTWLSIRLPKIVDSNEGELKARLRKRDRGADARLAETMPDRRLRSVGPSVLMALRANAALKTFAGFYSIFMAFLVRRHALGGLHPLAAIAIIATCIAVGSGIGSALGGWLKARAPEAIVTASVALSAVAAIVTAFFYSTATVLMLAAVAGVAPALAKLSLDASIQRDTLESVRTSAFARSETYLQLAWVIGGGLALALPSIAVLGISILAVGLCITALLSTKTLYDLRETRLG